jgi:hypothetical protein
MCKAKSDNDSEYNSLGCVCYVTYIRKLTNSISNKTKTFSYSAGAQYQKNSKFTYIGASYVMFHVVTAITLQSLIRNIKQQILNAKTSLKLKAKL